MPLAGFVRTTVAPGTTAPLGSLTAPRTSAESNWAWQYTAGKSNRRRKAAQLRRERLACPNVLSTSERGFWQGGFSKTLRFTAAAPIGRQFNFRVQGSVPCQK